jgi:hypothetical protein
LQLVSGASWLSDMFNGVALIIAVALSIKRSPSALGQRIRAMMRGGSAGGSGQPSAAAELPAEEVAASGAGAGSHAGSGPS